MRVKRTIADWIWLFVLVLIYIALAVLIAMAFARAEPARGCRPPDPNARPIVKLSRGEIRALAALAWAEARGESDAYCSMLAVSSVVINRMTINPQYFGATITQVINRPYAFSPFGRDDPNKTRMGKVDESDPLYISALLAAIAAVSGADNTMGSTHFYSGKPPGWSHRMLVKRRIGGHTFLSE